MSNPASDNAGAPQTNGRSLRAKGIARRDAIMDAAEEIFSERGYFGSSMRDVSAKSGAALGLISHYFPSKGALVQAVVLRKRDKLQDIVAASLHAAKLHGGSDFELIEAFIRPFLRACVDSQSDIRSYIKLTSHFMSTYQVPEVAPALRELTPISNLLRDHLEQATPGLSERTLYIAVYLIDAALIFMVQDGGFVEAVSEGQFTSKGINELIHPAVTFFTGGLRALAAPT